MMTNSQCQDSCVYKNKKCYEAGLSHNNVTPMMTVPDRQSQVDSFPVRTNCFVIVHFIYGPGQMLIINRSEHLSTIFISYS